MDKEKVIVIDFGGQYNSWLQDVSVNAMYIVKYILTARISRQSKR